VGDPPVPEDSLSEDARMRVLVHAITDYAIYMLDREGRVSSWNPGAERFKGYAEDEIVGQHFSKFYTPEDRAVGLPETALREADEKGRFEREGWRLRKDGTRFWAHVVIDPIRNESGQLIGFAKVTRDLTERRAAERALRASEEQFRLLVQGVTDYAIYMLDPTGRIASWNAGAEKIKGYSAGQIIGEHFSRFYTEEDLAAAIPERALKIAAEEGRFEKEGWRVRADGTRFWANVVIDPIKDETGEIIGFAKITRDITDRMEAQRALEEAREALLHSQKMEAIGQLTGGIAHDFNNLLMAVLGSLELLSKRLPDDARARALLDNAVQGARRGATLTQRMLAFARKQELVVEAVNVSDVVRGMTALLQRSLGPTVQLVTRIPWELPPVRTDANQLETALLNLILNARDAMPEGGTIRIEAFAEGAADAAGQGLKSGDYVRLVVTDEGSGMDELTLARAAEPFFTTKGVGRGTGLGLSMVHGLAEQSGGQLRLSSKLGEGTRAELWLPQAEGIVRAHVRPDEGTAASPDTPSLTVLAVDDDDLVLTNLTAMLEDLGQRVLAASSAAEALSLVSRNTVDLVITDFAMPKVNGVQLATALTAMYPNLPVVLATGFAELREGEAKALPRLAKPFTQADLARVLREQFAEARSGEPCH